MSLRVKCAILLIAFELTIAVTLLITVQLIRNYFDDAAKAISSSSRSSVGIRRLRLLLRDELNHFQVHGVTEESLPERQRIARDIELAVSDLQAATELIRLNEGDLPHAYANEPLDDLLEKRHATIARFEQQVNQGEASPQFPRTAHMNLDRFLGQRESEVFEHLSATAQGSFSAFYRSVLVLSINMIVGAALGIVGLILVRRWVLLPVMDLTHAADEIGRGHLDHRAQVRTHDELGRLALAINSMSADISRLNRQMVYRERAAAMGDLISYIAHNIRNPLAGIRSLADSSRRGNASDGEASLQHEEIIASVERLQHWLREVEHACRPLDVRPQPVAASEIIAGVVDVFRPMAARRDIEIATDVSTGEDGIIQIDAPHFEQALAAVVGNAIEACNIGGTVRIALETKAADRLQLLTVADTGLGIPEAVRDKVFQPSVSSKRDGTGLGLAMARRVAALHGGELAFDCPPTGGTVFRFTLPVKDGPSDG